MPARARRAALQAGADSPTGRVSGRCRRSGCVPAEPYPPHRQGVRCIDSLRAPAPFFPIHNFSGFDRTVLSGFDRTTTQRKGGLVYGNGTHWAARFYCLSLGRAARAGQSAFPVQLCQTLGQPADILPAREEETTGPQNGPFAAFPGNPLPVQAPPALINSYALHRLAPCRLRAIPSA